MIPWGVVLENPSYAFLIPFVWVLWQVYCPRIINKLAGKSASDGHLYDTAYTSLKTEFKSEFARLDNRVDDIHDQVCHIHDTQEDLKHITVAQSHMMNGYDGSLDVTEVEERLLDTDERTPADYLGNNHNDEHQHTDDSQPNTETEA